MIVDDVSQPVSTIKGEAVALAPQEAVKPTTTAEEQLHSASQRKVNLIWEYTQAFVAVATTTVFLVAAYRVITSGSVNTQLANAFFLIIGFYFGRTNHQNVGGTQLGR